MIKLPLLILLLYSFWNISLSSTIFISIAILFNLWAYSVQYLSKINTINEAGLTKKEVEILKKYHIYFSFPFTAKFNSSFASAIYLFGLILTIWLLWNGFWIKAVILAINAIASALISAKLNPMEFLHDAIENQNKFELREEMLTVDSVCEKIIENQRNSVNK